MSDADAPSIARSTVLAACGTLLLVLGGIIVDRVLDEVQTNRDRSDALIAQIGALQVRLTRIETILYLDHPGRVTQPPPAERGR